MVHSPAQVVRTQSQLEINKSVIPSSFEILRANSTMGFKNKSNRNKYALQLHDKYNRSSPDFKQNSIKNMSYFRVDSTHIRDTAPIKTRFSVIEKLTKTRPKHQPVRNKFNNGVDKSAIPIDIECPLDNKDCFFRQSLRPLCEKAPKTKKMINPTETNPPDFYQDDMKKWETKFRKSIQERQDYKKKQDKHLNGPHPNYGLT